MGSTKEQSPSTGARVRGALPGDAWRAYVSSGAEKAYDGPLKPGREEAAKLAHKGRLVAAHKREKASYKIRVRGYDRKRRGEAPLAKAYTSRTVAVGPVKYASKKLQLRKPTKGEERAEQLRALLGGVGTVKLAAGAGAGALVTDAVKDAQNKSKKAANAVRSAVTKPEETKVTKNLEGRTLLGPIAPDAPRSLVEIRKDAEEVSKVLGALKGLGSKMLSKVTSPITEPLKKKAKKYALYGAAGLGGTVAAGSAVGTAAGNSLSPRR